MVEELQTGSALAALLTLPGIGEKRAAKLAEGYGTWDALLAASTNDLAAVLGTAASHKFLAHRPVGPLHPDLPDGVQVVSRFEPHYPSRLAAIPDPPLLLWYRGTLPPPDQVAVAVVGTRKPTRWGAAVADAVSGQIAANGFVHVSGLAVGVDTAGHEAAIRTGGRTWAVLGQGVDTVTGGASLDRPGRARLAHQILDSGGGLLAEVPPGTPTATHLLTKRNRIQSGLCDAVVIAETGLATPDQPAGTLHTVRYALAQRRQLLVPRPPERWQGPRSAGNLALTDPQGVDPTLLHVTDPRAAEEIRGRRPAADAVISDREHAAQVIAHLDRFLPASEPADDQGDQTEPLW